MPSSPTSPTAAKRSRCGWNTAPANERAHLRPQMSALTFQALRRLADGRFHSGEDIARALNRSRATLSEALKAAPELGVELFSIPGKGYRLAAPIEFLDAAAIAKQLEGTRIRLQVVDEIESTSTRLLEMAESGAPPGPGLAAEWQSSGRGRRGRGRGPGSGRPR